MPSVSTLDECGWVGGGWWLSPVSLQPRVRTRCCLPATNCVLGYRQHTTCTLPLANTCSDSWCILKFYISALTLINCGHVAAVGGLRLRSCSGGSGATCDEAAAVAGPSSLARAEVPQLLLGLQPPNQTSPRPREARQAAASLRRPRQSQTRVASWWHIHPVTV